MRKVIIIGMLASLAFITAAMQATAYEIREVQEGGTIYSGASDFFRLPSGAAGV